MKHFSAQVLPVKLPPYFQPHFLWILMCIKCCSTLTCFLSSVEMLFSCLSLLSKAQDFLQRPWFIIHPWLHTSHIVCLRSALINVSAAFLLSARLCSFCECPCFVMYILYYIFSIFAFNFWFNFSCISRIYRGKIRDRMCIWYFRRFSSLNGYFPPPPHPAESPQGTGG